MTNALKQQLNEALEAHQYSEALTLCSTLLSENTDDPNLTAIKGWCMHKLGDSKPAQALLVKAFNREPSQHYAATMLMSFYMETADYQQVVTLAQYCVGVHSQDRLMWHRLATAHFMLGDLAGAVIAFRRSLHVEYSELTAFALSQPLLCQGQYQEGFELYELRFAAHNKLNWPQAQRMPMPKWQGEALAGKSLLIWTEQGLGDCIQFVRIATHLAKQGASIDLMLPKQHASAAEILQSTEGVEQVNVVHDSNVVLRRPYDFQSPLMSLMKYVQLTPEIKLETHFPYINVPEGRSASNSNPALVSLLSGIDSTKLNIGLVWSTALLESFKQRDYMHFKQKDIKSLRTQDINPVLNTVLQTTGIQCYSLHVAKSPAVQDVLDKQPIIDSANAIKSFTDTAMIIDAMDLIISIDTSVAHLAGAMNKPVINLLPYAADWRWQTNREDTPWYPSMRLLRQTAFNDWSSVTTRLQQLLPKIQDHHKQTSEVCLYFQG